MPRKSYSQRWTEDQTKSFIKARIALDDKFANGVLDVRDAWELVGKTANISEDWQKLRKKWRNLLDKYKSITAHRKGTTTLKDTWPYYGLLHEYRSSRHNSDPIVLNVNESCSSELGSIVNTVKNLENFQSWIPTVKILAPSPTPSRTSLDDNASTSNQRRQQEKSKREEELHHSILKTGKEIRKTMRLFSLFLMQNYDLKDGGSDSD